jgi:putative ABC transport system ATP-binding protein
MAALLSLEEAVKHYRGVAEAVRAVDGVSLRLAPGEMVALQGPSGSGKTTLLLLSAGLLKPERGVIRYQGRDLSTLSEQQACDYLLRDVAIIHQSVHLQPRVSAIDNASTKLLFAGVGVRLAQARAQHWLELVGLADRLEHTPEQLSGGERQRVAIARALASEPQLILADEPTGKLDSLRSREVVDLLGHLSAERGASVLLVTHDAEVAALAHRRLYMRDGRLVDHEDGPNLARRSARPAFEIGVDSGQ